MIILHSGKRVATMSRCRGSVHSKRRLGDERRARVQQHRQLMARGVLPQRVEPLVVRQEAGVHRQQLDAAQPELLVADVQFAFPAVLRRVDG